MKDKDKKNVPEEEKKEEARAAEESAEAQATPEAPADESELLKKEKDELNDKYLRLAAEYDNFKKRTAKEKSELFFTAKAQVLSALLPVFDNLERARDCTTDKDQLAEGVEMILKQFDSSLEKIGITEIKAMGETFDPELHEAVFHEEAEGEPENTVSQVLQKGYVCDGKVIRHAMVKVVN